MMNKEEFMTSPTPQGTSQCSCLEHCFLLLFCLTAAEGILCAKCDTMTNASCADGYTPQQPLVNCTVECLALNGSARDCASWHHCLVYHGVLDSGDVIRGACTFPRSVGGLEPGRTRHEFC